MNLTKFLSKNEMKVGDADIKYEDDLLILKDIPVIFKESGEVEYNNDYNFMAQNNNHNYKFIPLSVIFKEDDRNE